MKLDGLNLAEGLGGLSYLANLALQGNREVHHWMVVAIKVDGDEQILAWSWYHSKWHKQRIKANKCPMRMANSRLDTIMRQAQRSRVVSGPTCLYIRILPLT